MTHLIRRQDHAGSGAAYRCASPSSGAPGRVGLCHCTGLPPGERLRVHLLRGLAGRPVPAHRRDRGIPVGRICPTCGTRLFSPTRGGRDQARRAGAGADEAGAHLRAVGQAARAVAAAGTRARRQFDERPPEADGSPAQALCLGQVLGTPARSPAPSRRRGRRPAHDHLVRQHAHRRGWRSSAWASPDSSMSTAAIAISASGWRTVVSSGHTSVAASRIVEADDGDVVRHRDAQALRLGERAQRHVVVGREDGGRRIAAARTACCAAATPDSNWNVPGTTSARIDGDAVRLQRALVAVRGGARWPTGRPR